MNIFKKMLFTTAILSTLFSFNSFAMNNKYAKDPELPTPQNEKTYEDESLNKKWTWLSDELCVQFRKGSDKTNIERQYYNGGILRTWREYKNNKWGAKTRDTYTGQWSQSTEGIWSFEFDDKTIPVGVTKIDGVLYAFNGYGELKEGYNYFADFKTAADGLVTANTEEFNQWLTTQYLPECTSHKEEAETNK